MNPNSQLRLCLACDRLKPLSHFYSSGKPRCAAHLTWTQARRFRLLGFIDSGLNDRQIAEKMNTTEAAIHLARKRYKLPGIFHHTLSGRAVARMMGVGCEKTVTRWIERGFLRGRRIFQRGPYRVWSVSRDNLWAFVEDERTWHLWTVERITDEWLRVHAERVRGDVRFLTPGEVARRLYVEHGTVNQWIHKQLIPARKWGNWWIDERDVEGFEPPMIGGWREAA